METIIEEIFIYGLVVIMILVIVIIYLRKLNRESKTTEIKVAKAKEEGLYEPISLHPYIDLSTCIGSAACIAACPEKDILGIIDGKATVINTSNCVGHGACFHACPVEAISLRIGTEKRGVELPHVNENFETNMKGIFIAGELGGMGLIKNSVEQGYQAMEYMAKQKKPAQSDIYDVIIVGAGPAGISASLMAKKLGLTSLTLEQDSLGGTVFTFPRSKVVMTAPMDLPLYGKVKLYNTSKNELLELWNKVIDSHQLEIQEHTKVDVILPQPSGTFKVTTSRGDEYYCQQILLAIGRRGTPRKLNVPGEESQKVAYRLLEPDRIEGKKIVVVGGGDSGVESAMLLMENNEVTLAYRKDQFRRIKPQNKENINRAISSGALTVLFNTNLVEIHDDHITVHCSESDNTRSLENDLVYIFAGGELPTSFLQKSGVAITKRFGYIMKKHG